MLSLNQPINSRLYTEIEDTAEGMFFASVGTKGDAVKEAQSLENQPGSEPKVETNIVPNGSNNDEVRASVKNGKKGRNTRKKTSVLKKKNGRKKRPSKLGKKSKLPVLPLSDLKLGDKVEGYVAAFTDFGIFVRINYDLKKKDSGGGYALLHKSQIRDEPVENPEKVFRIGAVIKDLRVIQINHAKGEVGLSLRKQRQKRKSLSKFTVGREYEGKVATIVPYGAFVDVGAKANALLHISRISQKKIENIRNWVNEGDAVTIRIISKDEKKNTLAASMLDSDADKYLDKRSNQLKKMRTRSDEKNAKMLKERGLKSELEYFEDAVKELENALE